MTAESNKHTMERFIREFLTTGDAALAEQFISPDIVMHCAWQQQRGRDASSIASPASTTCPTATGR